MRKTGWPSLMNWNELVAECDAALRSGQIGRATEILNSTPLHQVPRDLRQDFANLCRRSGLLNEGLKLLSNLVRPKQGEPVSASEKEQAEYANLLMKIGSVNEAKTILEGLTVRSVPELKMFQAFCEIANWNYEAAIPLLKQFLESNETSYQSLIARVNLASALVWTENYSEALQVLQLLKLEAEKTKSLRLLANTLELSSQVHLHLNEMNRCEEYLAQAQSLLNSKSTSDQLFIHKWQAICLSYKLGNVKPLQEFRTEALSRQHWESVRECDFHTLKMVFDEKLFRHLICGTPHHSYRVKVCKTLKQEIPIGFYHFGETSAPRLDLNTGELSTGKALKGGKRIHQLIAIFLKDFYKPLSLGEIFSELCPDEYYNIYSSPARIHQVISRSRKFFEENEIPVSITPLDPGFSMQILGHFCFEVPFDRNPISGPLAQIQKLKVQLNEEFSVEDVTRLLEISKPSARRLLRWGIDNHHFLRFGAGPSTVYRFANLKSNSAA